MALAVEGLDVRGVALERAVAVGLALGPLLLDDVALGAVVVDGDVEAVLELVLGLVEVLLGAGRDAVDGARVAADGAVDVLAAREAVVALGLEALGALELGDALELVGSRP